MGVFWPKWSKGTSTDQDLTFEPITKSLSPSVQKFWPVQEKYDGQKDRRTPQTYRPPTFWVGWVGPNYEIVYVISLFDSLDDITSLLELTNMIFEPPWIEIKRRTDVENVRVCSFFQMWSTVF